MKSLMVIGGTGFFGKSILDFYQRGGLRPWNITSVKIIARSTLSLRQNFPNLIDKTIELYDADITCISELPFADYVIHAAASTDAKNYLLQPDFEKKNIHAAIENYSKLAVNFHRNSKVVFCSSGAVYGKQCNDLEFLSEDGPLFPIENLGVGKRDYAAAKRDAELIVRDMGSLGLSVSIARCFAFIGPYLPRKQHFAIGNFIEDGLNGRPINVNASLTVFRSYMYSDDLVRWLMVIASNGSTSCPIYNVGSDEEILITEAARQVGEYFSVPVLVKNIIKNDVDRYVPSIHKARQELGLSLEMNLAESIHETVLQLLK